LNIAVFASGRGSNLRSLADALHTGIISNATLSLVVSNNSAAGALEFARQNHIPAVHISRRQFVSDNEFVSALLELLSSHNVNFIVLAGYMKKLDGEIIRRYKNRILNIHPALLPAFGGNGMYGMNVHEAVIESKTKFSGATVHVVDEEYDHGSIILQERIEVLPNETAESLAERVLTIEHRIYPKAVNLFAQGKIQFVGDQVVIA